MIRNEYETTFIFRADLPEDEVQRLRARYEGIITSRGGQVMIYEDWGRRRFAYPINKTEFGRYMFLVYIAPGEVPAEVDRVSGIEDSVVRYLTVKNAENVNMEERLPVAVERQRKRIARAATQQVVEEERRDFIKGRRGSTEGITSPGPVRFENADGQVGDLSSYTPTEEDVEYDEDNDDNEYDD
jgi:small subunit ribosomal protein S6